MPKKCGNFASTTKLASSGLSLSLPVLLGCSAFRMRSSVRKVSSIEIRQTGHTAAFFKEKFVSSVPGFVIKKHTVVEVRCGGSIRGKGLAALPLCWFQALFT